MPRTNFDTEAVTPGRKSTLTFDISETVAIEEPFSYPRERAEIKPLDSSDVIRLASGVWSLKPLNFDLGSVQEETAAHSLIVRLAQLNAISALVEVDMFRQLSELTGLTYDASVAPNGDYFLRKQIAAGSTWNTSIGGTLSNSFTGSFSGTHVPVDRILEGPASGSEQAMTGYQVRISQIAPAVMNWDWFLAFYFGGPVFSDGYGQFVVQLAGDGRARLLEYYKPSGGSLQWNLVAEWQYRAPNGSAASAINLIIIPHFPNYIEVSTYTANFTQASFLGRAVEVAQETIRPHAASTYLHTITNRGSRTYNGSNLTPITGIGKIGMDLRRDLRSDIQISRLAYPASGYLIDRPFTLPYGAGSNHIVYAIGKGFNFFDGTGTLTSAAFEVQNADTGTVLTGGSESGTFNGSTYSYTGYQPAGGLNKIRVKATLATSESSPRYHSPALLGYEVKRNGSTVTVAPGEKTGGSLRSVAISGPDTSPDHESASLKITDEKDALPLLRTRARASVRLETQYDAADTTKTSILFEGYTGRVEAKLRGKLGQVYPVPTWHDYDVQAMGKWTRLQGRFFQVRQNFSDDSTSPLGTPAGQAAQPWKVTDVIRATLNSEGFLDAQLDIFDDPLRLFADVNGSASQFVNVAPGTPKDDFLTSLCSLYLNAFLVWDANAGSAGMWRLIRPPTGSETPVWNFVSNVAAAAGRVQHRSLAYGANTSPVLGPFPFSTHIIAPEGNLLTVTGGANPLAGGQGAERFQQVFANRQSWDAPGLSQADPTNMDWLGAVVPLEYIDQTLVSQQAVRFIGRRLYNLVCRGRRFARFTAELVLVQTGETLANGSDAYPLHTHRPLRIGDMVTLDSVPYMVRSCDPRYSKDWVQLADYSLEQFRTDLTWAY